MNKQKPLYNSRLLSAYLELLRTKYPDVNIREILAYAKIELHEVSDEGCWFTQLQIDRFYKKTLMLTGSNNIAREAGRVAASPGAIGAMRQYTLGLLGPNAVFQILSKATKNLTHASKYETKVITHNKVEITVTPNEGVNEQPFQCENRIGFFEAIVDGFHLGTPKIEQPECIFEGGSCCRYIVSWKMRLSRTFANIRNIFMAFLAFGVPLGLSVLSFKTFLYGFLPVSFLCLGAALITEILRRREMMRSMDNMRGSTEQLTELITTSSQNIQLVNEIGQALTQNKSVKDVLNTITGVMKSGLDFDCGAILLANREQTRLEIHSSYGYSKEDFSGSLSTFFSLNKPNSQGPFVQAFHQQKNFIINNTDEIEERLSPKSLKFVNNLGIHSFVCCPIIVDNKSLGVIAVTNRTNLRALTANDINLLQGISPAIGVAIQNTRLIEQLQRSFEKMVKVLGQSIDARDYLTAGHSEVVTEYASGIAEELGKSAEYIQMIRIAGLLHDYGKIAIPDSILKKNGRLTPGERDIINTHPVLTQQILDQVPFHGLQKQIPEITGAHHEHWDGSGYPEGLKGEEIPLGARIIAVADFFEAITSKRHYRDPMPMEKALRLLRESSGSHFEPKIVSAFMVYLERQNYSLVNPVASSNPREPSVTSRRKSPRVRYRTQTSIRLGKRTLAGDIIEIGVKGAFISCPNPVKKTEQLVISFALPDDEEFVQVSAEVCWINDKQSPVSTNHPVGFAVSFQQVPKQVQNMMNQFIRQQITPVSDRAEREGTSYAS